jgi:Erg28 like protein
VRAYAAYNIGSKEVYVIAFSTYAIALAHFGSECLVYKTMTMRSGLLPSFAVASVTTIWMAVQRGYYIAM